MSGWDMGFMPFALNESTRFISPTKTPEYLAAGRPVISTSIRDVVRPYGDQELVEIADTPDAFIDAAERLLRARSVEWLERVERFLSEMSWDRTWAGMSHLIDEVTSPYHVRIDTSMVRRVAAVTERASTASGSLPSPL